MAAQSGADRRSDPNFIAYEFLRDEIKREDGITFQRLSSALAFQAILMAAMALMVASGLPTATTTTTTTTTDHAARLIDQYNSLRVWLLFLIGGAGLAVGIGSLIGVHASVRSLRTIKETWEKLIEDESITLDPCWPQAYGKNEAHRAGHRFPYVMTISFIAIWIIYLGILIGHFVRVVI